MIKKIIEMNSDEVKESLKSNLLKVCVVGIGRIGLPTALSFADSGLTTIGLDINSKLVEEVNSGTYPLKDEPEYDIIFENVLKEQKFSATTNADESITEADIILLSLPTPMDSNNIPDYSALHSVGKQLSKKLPEGSLVIIESTIEPGFVEDEFVSLIEGDKKRLQVGKNFGIGVCPETANPGEIMKDFKKLPRLVGGFNKNSEDIIFEIYHHVFPVELIRMPNCKTANAVKLTTNVFRDINIAFINELSLLFEKLGIDTFKVLEAAKTKYNFQAHYPGIGVGGPCLPVNSYQFLNSASKFDGNMLRIVQSSREINERMHDHVIELLSDGLNEAKKSIKDSTVLILGISYKPNVKDIQLTPVEPLIKKLNLMGANIKIFDPFFKDENVFNIKTESVLENALDDIDSIILATAHNEFLHIEDIIINKNSNFVVVDSRGILDLNIIKNSGLIYRGIGRGNTK